MNTNSITSTFCVFFG